MKFITLGSERVKSGGGGGEFNRHLGRGVRPTQRNPDLFKTQRCRFLLPCLRESAVNFYPVQDCTKICCIQNNKKVVHKFVFHISQRRYTKSVKIMWLRGEDRSRRYVGATLFRHTCEFEYPGQRILKRIPSQAECPYITGNMWYPQDSLRGSRACTQIPLLLPTFNNKRKPTDSLALSSLPNMTVQLPTSSPAKLSSLLIFG